MGLEKQFIPPLNKESIGVRETVHTTPKTRGVEGVREAVHTTHKQGEYGA